MIAGPFCSSPILFAAKKPMPKAAGAFPVKLCILVPPSLSCPYVGSVQKLGFTVDPALYFWLELSLQGGVL